MYFVKGATFTVTEPLMDYYYDQLSRGRRRLLQQPNFTVSDGTSEIPNPLMCLELGEMIVFRLWVDQNDRTKSHYPKYVKDHLYNTNANFDYGDFTQLEYYITETKVNYTTFVYSFTESGTYVFADAQNSARYGDLRSLLELL